MDYIVDRSSQKQRILRPAGQAYGDWVLEDWIRGRSGGLRIIIDVDRQAARRYASVGRGTGMRLTGENVAVGKGSAIDQSLIDINIQWNIGAVVRQSIDDAHLR